MRKIIFIVVLFLGATFVYLSFGELQSILDTLRYGNFWFVLMGLLLQLGWIFVTGLTYLSLYRLVGLDGTPQKLSALAAAANFVNIVAPSAGVGGVAVFIADARRNGYSLGKVMVAGMLFLFLDYVAFLCVLILGLTVLFRRNDLGMGEVVASAVMFAIAIVFGFILYLGSRSADLLGNTLAQMARLVNRVADPFIHRDYLSEARAHEFAHEMADGLKFLPERPRSLAIPILFSFANKALLISVLLFTFMAFKVPFTVGTVIGGFAIAYLFLIISPTPAGIGIVEGMMPLALSSLRVPWSQAVIITLAYRGITFWVPFGIGAIAFRMLSQARK
ncbi:MAG TPA: lysylphosphatidylglycerol synthase transmembrane domain-containing protein [Anaerolineales bacterium]|nr:lysylphosphatidylglycerol synthase transmembrane domain-containing protein [Anaerolineales bacterium]